MDNTHKKQTRKRFIAIGISTAALFTAFRFFIPRKKKKSEKIKMLTQDGRLVEVEVSKLSSKRKKIKDADIHTWVQRKSSL